MTAKWAKAAVVRAAKTAAQAALAVIGASTAFAEVAWDVVGGTALLAAVVSVLTSVAGLPEDDTNGAPLELERGKHAAE